MSNHLSEADRLLTPEQQALILQYKADWETARQANNQAGMEQAHRLAEAVRQSAGYSGGSDGSSYTKLPTAGGKSADEVRKWVDDYVSMNYNDGMGWVNGFSVEMNVRSMANYIRQQMLANSQAWKDADAEGKAYLHAQNQQLAGILSDATGGAESVYNEALGRWETPNANLGYGVNVGQYQERDIDDWYKGQWGMTDEQIAQYRNDTDRYFNYVDQDLLRNLVDESSGYTGIYSQFVNGPFAILHQGTRFVDPGYYKDRMGDGFNEEGAYTVVRDENGNVIGRKPALKHTGDEVMSDYTKQFASYVDENGIIQPGFLITSAPASARNGAGGIQVRETPLVSGGGTLEQWAEAAGQQAANKTDFAVNQAVQQLLQAQQEAQGRYQAQQNQINAEERNALDNSALYAEVRGDRGGIGQSQYNAIQATAAANRQAVNAAQNKLASDTAMEIANLRAQGEFEKADALLEVAQTSLLKLLELEQWAAEFGLSQQKFQASLYQWEQEFARKAAKV